MKKINFTNLAKKHLKFLPNTLTIFNSICGFIAIIYTLRAYEHPEDMNVFCISAIMIFSAMVFDALDGLAARALDATSEKGIQMDSLSDMVTFGVAPAVLVAIMTHSLREWSLDRTQEIIVYALCSIYIGCAALRLATYNVMAMDKEHKKDGNYFSGLPSPGAAAALCVMVFFAADCKIPIKYFAVILPVYAAILGLLMVSKVRYIHAGRWLFSMWKNRIKFFIFIIMLAIIAVFRLNGLVFLVTAYIISGPIGSIFARNKKEEQK